MPGDRAQVHIAPGGGIPTVEADIDAELAVDDRYLQQRLRGHGAGPTVVVLARIPDAHRLPRRGPRRGMHVEPDWISEVLLGEGVLALRVEALQEDVHRRQAGHSVVVAPPDDAAALEIAVAGAA